MDDDERQTVARPLEPPEPDEVLAMMSECRSYVVADLVDELEEYEPPRGTVRNRLESLVDDGDVERTKHSNGTVTYRRRE